jgi:hypothetical protein
MHRLHRETFLPAPREQVFAFFSDPQNLARITPPSLGFSIVERPERTLRAGDRIRYHIRLFGIRIGWTTRITDWVDGVSRRRPLGAVESEEDLRLPGRGDPHHLLLITAGGLAPATGNAPGGGAGFNLPQGRGRKRVGCRSACGPPTPGVRFRRCLPSRRFHGEADSRSRSRRRPFLPSAWG